MLHTIKNIIDTAWDAYLILVLGGPVIIWAAMELIKSVFFGSEFGEGGMK